MGAAKNMRRFERRLCPVLVSGAWHMLASTSITKLASLVVHMLCECVRRGHMDRHSFRPPRDHFMRGRHELFLRTILIGRRQF